MKQSNDLQEHTQGWAASERPAKLLRVAIVGLSCLFVLLFLYAALRRMRYPFEVEWIESNVLISVLRILHGQGLYVAPTAEFVPYLYAPVYLYLSAALAKIVGAGPEHGYLAMRLLSTVATLGSAGVIYLLVRSESQRRIAAVAAAGLYLGGYQVLGAFFDIGRVDSLFCFFLLTALLAQRRGYPVVAALLWVVTFQTKQTVLPLAVLVLLAEWQRPKKMVAALATFVAGAGVTVLLMNHATDGWYGFYLFKLAGGFGISARQTALYLPQLVMEPVAIAWVVIATAIVITGVNLRSPRTIFYATVSFALYAGTWFVEAHVGASSNAMMPVYAWTAVLFGVSVARLLECADERGTSRMKMLVLMAAAVQLFCLIYNPGRYVPTAAARLETQAFVDRLRTIPGDVLVVNHSYDALLAGKKPTAEGEAFGAVIDAKRGAITERMKADLDAPVKAHRYAAIVIDGLDARGSTARYDREYPLAISTGLMDLRYMTSQAQWILLPCDASEATIKALMTPDTIIENTGCNVALEANPQTK